MYQFFVEESQIDMEGRRATLTGDNYNHLVNVLRIKSGEEFAVSNGVDGKEYRCSLLEIASGCAICEIRFVKESDNELPIRVHLYQGLPKSDKMELIIQKMVELGVCEIIPVNMSRCVMKLEDKKIDNRIARWNAISEAAAKQSKRKIVPKVRKPLGFGEALKEAAGMNVKLIPYELSEGMDKTRELLSVVKAGDDIAVFIGPEGGISEKEIEKATQEGFTPITLGSRILRTETAGMTLMAVLAYLTEGMN